MEMTLTQMNINAEIGGRVRARRERLEMRQEELASILFTTGANISRKESGKIPFTAEELAKIATALDCEISYLYGEDDQIGPAHNTYYEGLRPASKTAVDEIIRALWEKDQREDITHGKKAE